MLLIETFLRVGNARVHYEIYRLSGSVAFHLSLATQSTRTGTAYMVDGSEVGSKRASSPRVDLWPACVPTHSVSGLPVIRSDVSADQMYEMPISRLCGLCGQL